MGSRAEMIAGSEPRISFLAIKACDLRLVRCTAILFLLAGIVGSGCTKRPAPPPAVNKQPDGTTRMAARLKRLLAEIDPTEIRYGANDQRIERIRKQLEKVTEWKPMMSLKFALATELLGDARNAEVLACLDKVDQGVKERGMALNDGSRQALRMLRVQANMRIGETDNCCSEHNTDSCLIPLQGSAIYRHPEGPRNAIKLLEEQLAEVPDDLTARWLLNIAHMTLGEYPAGVPAKWLIDPKVFASDYNLKRFNDVAPAVGLDTFGHSGGCVVADFDKDGFLDIVRSDFGFSTQMQYFQNNGDGTFTDRTEAAGLIGEVGGLNMIAGDYDNDGNLDILVLRGGWLGKAGRFPKSLLRNNGDGTFVDVTEEAGLLIAHPTQTAVWFDYDNDGWIDLFVGNETEDLKDPHPCELFHNNRDGTFTECALSSGVQLADFVKGVASGDYNNDGRPDLFISQRRGGCNYLLRNDGPRDPANPNAGWKFTNVSKVAGFAEPMSSFPCWFFDYDNDGWQDIFVCGYAGGVPGVVKDYLGLPGEGERPRLYHNNGDGTFTNVAPKIGLNQTIIGMSGNYGDLDNDGYLDFFIGTGEPSFTGLFPNRMFRNDGGKMFQDVTTAGGFGNLQKGHGVAFADLNNDGQQDIYEVLGGAYTGDKYYTALYANPGHENHWVILELEGVKSNRSALGARIRVIAATPTGERSIYRTVSTGGSFGASPLRQHVGLGNAESIKAIEIYWPTTGTTQRIPGVPMDRLYTIREDSAAPIPREMRSFDFPDPRRVTLRR
jgi:hypothetical protein